MINILSWLGMTLQSEVCLWSMLGLITTIFDATLFKVNANLKQVWQMKMPEEITLPVQRVLRTMISGVMLVQCFTVYVYLASYIVLLYPVFLEERPTLVLPWLLLAAVRKLLCELTSLALGLGTCVLVGAARPPCIRFVIIKILSLVPSFYMWMLTLNYYQSLKIGSAFKSFATVATSSDHDLGLELAVRRRRTKSLFDEQALRQSLVDNLYKNPNANFLLGKTKTEAKSPPADETEDVNSTPPSFLVSPTTNLKRTMSDSKISEEFIGTEIVLPRASDRIIEQFVMMLLQIGAYKLRTGESADELRDVPSSSAVYRSFNIGGPQLVEEETDTSPQVDNTDHRGVEAAYITEFPKIFMKRNSTSLPCSTRELKSTQTQIETDDKGNLKLTRRSVFESTEKTVSIEIERLVRRRKYSRSPSKNKSQHSNSNSNTAEKTVQIDENSKHHHLENVYTNKESIASTPAEIRSENSNDFIKEKMKHLDKFDPISEETTLRSESKVHFSENINESTQEDTRNEEKIKVKDNNK